MIPFFVSSPETGLQNSIHRSRPKPDVARNHKNFTFVPMKPITKTILAGALLAGLIWSCNEKRNPKTLELTKTDWLLGSWINESANGTLSESWQKQNDSVYRGESYFVKQADTIHFESIVLSERNGSVFYSPTVRGQNNDKPVDFKLTSATASQLVFENPAHDFPQKIIYHKITGDSLVAEISGMQQGKPGGESYPMRRK